MTKSLLNYAAVFEGLVGLVLIIKGVTHDKTWLLILGIILLASAFMVLLRHKFQRSNQ
jgi:LPXTG-motif cell wall-anchored protein